MLLTARSAPSAGLQVQNVYDVREVVRELSSTNGTEEFAWFRRLREQHFSQQLWPHRDVCSKVAASSADQPSAPADQVTVVTTAAEGIWGSPQFDCARARSWTVAYSVPFFGCTSHERKLGFKCE